VNLSIRTILWSLLCLALISCSPQKKVQRRGGYLLVKNVVRADHPNIPEEELEGFIQQTATEGRLTLLSPGVWIWEKTSAGKQTKFKKKVREKFGTAPVILDPALALPSEHNIRLYLKNKGFHHPQIRYEFRYKRAHAKAIYTVLAGQPYTIRKINHRMMDNQLQSILLSDTANSLLKPGMIYDTYLLDDERDRIITMLRTRGYYNFSKSELIYIADTSGNNLQADLILSRRQSALAPALPEDSAVPAIPTYHIRNISVVPDVEFALNQEHRPDTLTCYFPSGKEDTIRYPLYVIQGAKTRLKPDALTNAIALRPGQAFNQELVTQSYKRLIGMPIIRSASISMISPEGIPDKAPGEKWLDCNIRLTRNPVNLLSVGTEGTSSGGSLGMGFNASFQNRNIFRKAETFRLKIHTGAEVQGNTQGGGDDQKLWIFNALETGVETGIDFPRLLLPSGWIKTDRNYQTRTSFAAGYGFESRPNYSRNVTTFSASYQWSSSQKIKQIFTPLELNFVGIEKDSAFQAYLNSLTDPQFIGQYNNHLLTMIRHSFIFSNMATIKERRPFYLRINAETSGNVFHTIDRLSKTLPEETGYYKRFGVRYAQYIRTDIDFRKFWRSLTDRTLAFRFMTGMGIPYGNSEGIPFEKSFWLGGANDMRGWKLRSLGPGNYVNDSLRYDRTGDLMIFSSIEYRFPVYSFLNGGLFADAGNIWLRNDNPDFPGGTFRFRDTFNHLALDAGFGLRFDFSFFIFRLDWAFRMKNPAYESQWFNSNDFRLRKAVWNFGIGYPF